MKGDHVQVSTNTKIQCVLQKYLWLNWSNKAAYSQQKNLRNTGSRDILFWQ